MSLETPPYKSVITHHQCCKEALIIQTHYNYSLSSDFNHGMVPSPAHNDVLSVMFWCVFVFGFKSTSKMCSIFCMGVGGEEVVAINQLLLLEQSWTIFRGTA